MRLAVEHVRIGIVAFLLAAGCACQTAQKPATLLPPGSAPSLHPAAQAQTQPAQPVAAQISEAPQEAQKQDSPKTETSAAPASDPIADLIARVEKDYQAGLDNYRNGKKEEAKQNFDRAMNALLESNFDVRSDERLQKEFDRVVQGVNDIYPGGTDAGAQQADAQQDQQQKSEPAPIDETNQLAPSADARTKAKAEAEIKSTRSDLPLMMTDQVAGYIAYFQGYGRGVFERALSRSGRYHDMIVATLKDQGLPQDLIYLAQAESDFIRTPSPAPEPAASGSSWPTAAADTVSTTICGSMTARIPSSRPAPPPVT